MHLTISITAASILHYIVSITHTHTHTVHGNTTEELREQLICLQMAKHLLNCEWLKLRCVLKAVCFKQQAVAMAVRKFTDPHWLWPWGMDPNASVNKCFLTAGTPQTASTKTRHEFFNAEVTDCTNMCDTLWCLTA